MGAGALRGAEQVLSTNVNGIIVYIVGLERVSWVIWGSALQ